MEIIKVDIYILFHFSSFLLSCYLWQDIPGRYFFFFFLKKKKKTEVKKHFRKYTGKILQATSLFQLFYSIFAQLKASLLSQIFTVNKNKIQSLLYSQLLILIPLLYLFALSKCLSHRSRSHSTLFCTDRGI